MGGTSCWCETTTWSLSPFFQLFVVHNLFLLRKDYISMSKVNFSSATRVEAYMPRQNVVSPRAPGAVEMGRTFCRLV